LRTTAAPTARETTKPTRGAGGDVNEGVGEVCSGAAAWTTSSPVPRTPRVERTVATKSARRRSRAPAGSTAQAERRVRPLERRAARMARPARVRIRRRKPWVLARRRLFGWNVRLLTRGLLDLRSGSAGGRLVGRGRGADRPVPGGNAAAVVDATDNGTVGGRRWSNRPRLTPSGPVTGRNRSSEHGAGFPTATPRRWPGKKRAGCGQPVAGRPAGLLASRRSSAPSPVVRTGRRRAPSPTGGRGLPSATMAPNRDISGATDVHRLWTSMWTRTWTGCQQVRPTPVRWVPAAPPGPVRSTSGPDRRVRHERVTG
jgi:hypothetical protein